MTEEKVNLSGKTVVVGLTGRVDSAVAAYLLKKQGMNVIGLGIITANSNLIKDPTLLPHCYLKDLEQIKKLCNVIGIPFYATDAVAQFENDVVDEFVASRLSARSENTCFNCNQMRIRILYQKMLQLDADYLATGHYAKIYRNIHSGQYFVHSNNDVQSDQSFMLGGLPDEILHKLQLPLGDLRKADVVKIAKRFGLPVADQSQSIKCFNNKSAINQMLRQRLPESLIREGQSYFKNSGAFAGDHQGIVFHYLGEKDPKMNNPHGHDSENMVVDYNFDTQVMELGKADDLTFQAASLSGVSMSKGIDISHPIRCYLKFKHAIEFMPCTLFLKNNHAALLQLDDKVFPLVKNDVLIFYDSKGRNSKIIGQGRVNRPGEFKLIDRVDRFRRNEDLSQPEEEKIIEDNDVFKF